MSPSSRRLAPAFLTVLVGALWSVGRLQVEMIEICKRQGVESHQGDHLVTSSLWSEYVVVQHTAATAPADSLNQRLT